MILTANGARPNGKRRHCASAMELSSASKRGLSGKSGLRYHSRCG